jgi:hypothetical protein
VVAGCSRSIVDEASDERFGQQPLTGASPTMETKDGNHILEKPAVLSD